MREIFELIERAAEYKTTVLVTGESGVGKEVVARAVHGLSDRAAQPFVAVNCGAIPETLIESELFGHVRGAFTGADSEAPGMFREADGGTLFLDEIGELPLVDPGQAAARAAGGGGPPGRRGEDLPGRRAHHRRHRARPRARWSRRGHLPRRPLLPPERLPHPRPAAARAARGRARCSPTSCSRRSRAGSGKAVAAARPRACSTRSARTPGRATCASSRTRSSAR